MINDNHILTKVITFSKSTSKIKIMLPWPWTLLLHAASAVV